MSLNLVGIDIGRRVQQAQKMCDASSEELEEFFRRYRLIDGSLFEYEELLASERTKLIRTEDKIYFGEIEGRSKHGLGISVYKEGHIY